MKPRRDRGERPGRDAYRSLTAGAVLIVAGIAATVSYLHISKLALAYGQPAASAYLMPLSVDGLVTVSSLAMLRSARAGFSSPVLARTGLFLSILATLGANVASGLSHGPVGSVVAGWPAVAFVISAEIAITMVRRKPVRAAVREPVTSIEPAGSPEPGQDAERAGRAAKTRWQDETALSALTANPDLSHAELAAVLGQSERTARRVVARLNGQVPASGQRESGEAA